MDNRNVQFCVGSQYVDLVQLLELFDRAAFWAKGRSLQDMAIALSYSEPVITIWKESSLIGHARATSDGVYRATIWDVVVHPDFQGSGLGRKLVQTVLSHPRVCRVERVYLTTTHQQSFYERIGFEVNDSTTMVLYTQKLLPDRMLNDSSNAVAHPCGVNPG